MYRLPQKPYLCADPSELGDRPLLLLPDFINNLLEGRTH